jgi:hypothetical protein
MTDACDAQAQVNPNQLNQVKTGTAGFAAKTMGANQEMPPYLLDGATNYRSAVVN